MNFHTWLRRSREHLDMARPELARQLGVHVNTIANYESGSQIPDDDKLDKIAIIFKSRFIDLWAACHEKAHHRVVEILEQGEKANFGTGSLNDAELDELSSILREHPKLRSAVLKLTRSLLGSEDIAKE